MQCAGWLLPWNWNRLQLTIRAIAKAKPKGKILAEGYICDGDIMTNECFIDIYLCRQGPDVAAVPCTKPRNCRRVVVMEVPHA
jgi:hypothetical protein